MEAIIVSVIFELIKTVNEMSDNWNNPNYKPPTADYFKDMKKQLEDLPNLPT